MKYALDITGAQDYQDYEDAIHEEHPGFAMRKMKKRMRHVAYTCQPKR